MQQQRRVTWPPRNSRSILEARRRGALKPGDHVAISFVGSTDLDMPHVFVDSGMRYDLGFLEGLHVSVVAAPGIDAQPVLRDALALTWSHPDLAYPHFVDFERQVAGVIYGAPGDPKLWQLKRESEPWVALFG